MSYSYQEQIDRFAVELADEAIQKKKNPDYKESLSLYEIAGSLSRIYDIEHDKALRDLTSKRTVYMSRKSG